MKEKSMKEWLKPRRWPSGGGNGKPFQGFMVGPKGDAVGGTLDYGWWPK